MSELNPYQSPEQPLTVEGAEEYGDINIFSTAGRLGRLRFIAYSLIFTFVLYILLAIVMGITVSMTGVDSSPFVSMIAIAIFSIAAVVVSIMLMSQRLHDANNSAWWILLVFVPIVSFLFTLYLWFMPGTKGANEYGNPPPPNRTALYLVIVFGAIALIGILAAIAIPAYQDYVIRAQQAGMGQP